MSKRNRYQKRQVINERRDLTREQEILNAPAEDFFSHHPIVRELLAKLPTASELEAKNIGLILQQMIRGDGSLLSNQLDPAVSEEINHIRTKAVEIQKSQEQYDTDQIGFVQGVLDQADKIVPQGAKRDQVIAAGVLQYQQARENAAAQLVSRKMQFHKQIESGPKELIHTTDEIEFHSGVPVKVPTVIRIMDRTWVLPEGDHMVPLIVARRWKEIESSRNEIAERKTAALSTRTVDHSHDALEAKNQAIDKKYRVKRQRVAFTGEEY